MSEQVVISVKDLHKDFVLPHEKVDSIKGVFAHPFKRRKVEMQHALKNISFDIQEGEFFGIVGRNGSGKSTLLKIMAGIYQPTKGTVNVNGRLVPFIELGVGFNPELTGRENVFLNGALMGFSTNEVNNKYHEIVEFAELKRFMDQKLKNYSSGMQVRLAFSVATILAESDILLIDEVLAVGDADFQRKCFDYFRLLKKRGKTVIFVTHDMNSVIEYCDRAILIEGGRVAKHGKPEDITDAYKRLFLRESPKTKVTLAKSERWGDGAITLFNPKISKNYIVDKDRDIELTFQAKVTAPIETPIFGFSITSPNGGTILGTNNEIKQQRLSSMNNKDVISLTWTIPNIFSDGTYYINLDATYNNGLVVADRWGNALSFKVNKLEKTPYVASPNIKLSIEPKYNDSQVR